MKMRCMRKCRYVRGMKGSVVIAIVMLLLLYSNNSQTTNQTDEPVKPNFKVLWYNLPAYIKDYQNTKYLQFKNCRFNNCQMTFHRTDANISHVVIFDGRLIPEKLSFTRPTDQVWIFAADETPLLYGKVRKWWYRNVDYIFNWTMTYNKDKTDIFLPYGEILKRKHEVKRDFKSIAFRKNKTLLMIASHCKTNSKRQEFVSELKKYVDVEILGKCGKKWNCGVRYKHNNCFQLLNTSYKFFLAFENALCHQYFTEKFYENYNYDVIMVTRGGSIGEASKIFPTGTYISTDDFKSIKDLGQYLKNLSTDDYADLLRRKSQFYSPGYPTFYQRALCDICERMNNVDKYRKTIKDIKKWAYGTKSCREVKDVHLTQSMIFEKKNT